MSSEIQYSARQAKPVLPVEALEDYLGRNPSLSGSKSLTELGITLHDNVEAITINPSGDVYYTPDGGTASTSNFPLATNQAYTIYGSRTKLEKVRLYAASATTIGIIQHIRRQRTVVTTTT